ncbi:hypothetical protein, partial [Pseudomonas sp. FEN]
ALVSFQPVRPSQPFRGEPLRQCGRRELRRSDHFSRAPGSLHLLRDRRLSPGPTVRPAVPGTVHLLQPATRQCLRALEIPARAGSRLRPEHADHPRTGDQAQWRRCAQVLHRRRTGRPALETSTTGLSI